MRKFRLLLGLPAVVALAAVLAVTAVLVIILRPSGSAVALGGPLGPPGNQSTVCLPSRLGHAVTIGLQDFTNSGHDAVIIDRVTLGAPRNLRLAGAYAVPGRYAVGVWESFPPPAGQLLQGVQWAKRRQPAGTRIPPGAWVNVVAGVEPTRKAKDTSTGIIVWYRDGSTHYELRTNVRMIVSVPPARCRP
jgi:hypothetical protein